MSYIKADSILPQELLLLVQEYADGQYLYIPRKADHKKIWGESTDSRKLTKLRNTEIYERYKNGASAAHLADEYYLSIKSIHRIILLEKNIHEK